MSVGQRGGGRGGEGAGGRGRGGGGGGLGLQAVEGVAPWGQHHSHPGQEPATELILVEQTYTKLYFFWTLKECHYIIPYIYVKSPCNTE